MSEAPVPASLAAPLSPAARRRRRLPILALGFAALLAGLLGGALRLGYPPPLPAVADLALLHGPLMVAGFFGTVIGIERAVAAGERWLYGAPVLSGGGAVLLLAGASEAIAAAVFTVASALLLAGSVVVLRRQPAMFTAAMAAGVLAWGIGNILWLAGVPFTVVTLWWAGFLVLVIAGERLELSRMLGRMLGHGRQSLAWFAVAAALLLAGLVVASLAPGGGVAVAGAGLLGVACWLGRYDIARLTIRRSGFVRFAAAALLLGYGWLAAAGAMALVVPEVLDGGYAYDAFVHAIFPGFVFSMVFAHAPIILPAVLAISVPYHPAFYVHLALLHGSLLLRVLADAWLWADLRAWAGLGNIAALVLFIAVTVIAVLGGARRRTPAKDQPSPPARG